MRRSIEIIPSVIFILFILYSFYLRLIGGHWVNFFIVGLTCTSVYSLVIVFIDGLSNSFNMGKKATSSDKLFYTFMIVLWVISTVGAIYLMAHN